jgi:hypothetical protein
VFYSVSVLVSLRYLLFTRKMLLKIEELTSNKVLFAHQATKDP